jgi:serine phosphatase RsbU (regulator of sigma subunit)
MENHNEMYFTIWYGVFQPSTGRLRYASAGHPPPILVGGPADLGGNGKGGPRSSRALAARGPCMGLLPDARSALEECTLVSPAHLYVFSDGVYEITNPDGTLLGFEELENHLVASGGPNGSGLEAILRFAREVRGGPVLEDDFSIVRLTI